MKKRLFTFGCSYTAYSWPAWSDLLSTSYDVYENWGMAGLGNRAIAERVAECHIKHKFTPEDTIIVQWSTHLRHDFFHQEGTLTDRVPGWKTAGSIFNYLNFPIYDRAWLETFFDEEAYFMHTLNNIYLTQNLLENTGATWYMTGIGDVRELGTDIDIAKEYGEVSLFTYLKEKFARKKLHYGYDVTPALEVYNNEIWIKRKDKWVTPIAPYVLKRFKEPFYSFKSESGEKFTDHHPNPRAHREWLVNNLIPKLGIDYSEETYNSICDDTDKLHQENIMNTKKDFERSLFKHNFALPRWPNMIKGFYLFTEDNL